MINTIPVNYKKYYLPVLFTVTIIVFYPILNNDFLYRWDDIWVVMNHYTEGGLGLSNIWAILSEFHMGQYGPVNEYMFLFLYELFGYNPLPFHLASLLIHLGSVCMVYIVIVKIITNTTRMQIANKEEIAFLTALIFAIHPMNVESVAWVSAVKILNYSFYYLIATYVYIIYLDKKQIKYYILTVIMFILSFGGKEQAVTFPVWLIMLTYIMGYNLRNRRTWLTILPFFVLAIFFGIVTIWSQAAIGSGLLGEIAYYPLWQRAILGCYSLFEYVTKLILPYNLMYIYPFPNVVGEPLPTSWIILYPSLIIIIITTLWRYITRGPIACGVIFFFIHIAVTLHIIPLSRVAIIADRYVYLSSIGYAFIVAYFIVYLYKKSKSQWKRVVIGIFSCIVLSLGIYSNTRSREWYNTDSIKKDLREIIKKRPKYVPTEDEKNLLNEE